MDPRAQLIEASKHIRRLIDMAAAPARRESAMLAAEAAPVKAQRAAARERADQAKLRVQRLGWMPFLGDRLAQRLRDAEKEVSQAERVWSDLRARARSTTDMIHAAQRARLSVDKAEKRASRGDPLPPSLAAACEDLLARARFLNETDGREASRVLRLAPKVLQMAAAAESIALAWDGHRPAARHAIASPPPPANDRVSFNRPVEPARRGKPSQLALDFDGTGQVEPEPRIWLPVSSSRTREMLARGARLDRDAPRRGSQLWIPVSERHKFEPLLPLAFRRQATRFSFPPIRHNAVGQNLWSVFDQPSWNHIRTTAYDRAGHRCQICGKQGGSLWSRLTAPEERKRGGVVDCHEVWDWEVVDCEAGIGIQKLKRLLVLCKDCHLAFHDGFALWKAREAGLEDQAAAYIKTLRQLVNRCDGATLEGQLAQDRAEWEENKEIESWVLDLSHLACQDFMADHTLVLKEDNRAGVTPAHIGGIAFSCEDGTAFAAQDAEALARGAPSKPVARPLMAMR